MGFFDGATFYPNERDQEPIHIEHGMHEPDGQNIKELLDIK